MTQQVFLSAFKSIASFKHRGAPFSAWLFQVVDYLRKKSKRVTVPLNESLTSGGSDPRLEVERNLDIEHLERPETGGRAKSGY